jgi:hypothetical protein
VSIAPKMQIPKNLSLNTKSSETIEVSQIPFDDLAIQF